MSASLALRLAAPVFIALIPLLFFTRSTIEDTRDTALEHAQSELRSAATTLKTNEQLVIDDARRTVQALSTRPAIRGGGAACTELLQSFVEVDQRFANLGVVSATGRVVCSALPVPDGTNLADRTYVQDAIRYGEPAVGNYQVGRITGVPSINFGYPVEAPDGRVVQVVFAALKLEFLSSQIEKLGLPENVTAVVFDRDGTILIAPTHPGRVGDPAFSTSISALDQSPALALRDFVGQDVIATTSELTGGVVAVAIPRADVEAPAASEVGAAVRAASLAVLLGGGLAFGLVWLVVQRPIDGIRRALRQLASGDLSTRLRPASSVGTLNALATDIDDVATSLELAQNELRQHAFHDLLTGLPNRLGFLDALAVRPVGIMVYLRVEALPDITATIGHDAADDVIRSVARRVEELAAGATAARISDGGFAILYALPEAQRADAEALMRRLSATMRDPVLVGDVRLPAEVRLGAALLPLDTDDPQLALRMAELAARGAHRNDGGTLFDPNSDQHKAENLALLTDMRDALADDELAVFYQPIVALTARDALTPRFEALLRWSRPDGRMHSPGEFIPLAERTGLIEEIDRWVIEHVAYQLEMWAGRNFYPRVAVNLSAHSLTNRDLPAFVGDTLGRHRVGPTQLKAEITETAFVEGFDGALSVCRELAALGIPISVDDFGMGYGSLRYLQEFPVSTLKVDRSFVRELGQETESGARANSIVEAISTLAQRMDLGTIAEGVETEEMLGRVRTLGISSAQGYLYAPALPPDAALDWTRSYSASHPRSVP